MSLLSTVVLEAQLPMYTLHFVETEIPCCDHTRFHSPPKAPEAA